MGASAMIAAAIPLALLAALQSPTLPADSLVVFGREPVCHMGRTAADGTKVRIEYHPLDDSYHLLVSGPAAARFAAAATPLLTIRSGFDRHLFRGSIIAATGDMPAAVYASLSVPQWVAIPDQNVRPRNLAIERRLFDPRGLQLAVDDRPIATFTGDVTANAARELIKCSNRFVPNGRSSASLRVAKREAN